MCCITVDVVSILHVAKLLVEAAVKIAAKLVLDLPLFDKKDITIMCILPQAVGVSFKMRPSELLAADSHVVELL